MPAKSKKQQTAARIARSIQKGEQAPKPGTASAEMAKTMTGKEVREFARKQLPKSHGGRR